MQEKYYLTVDECPLNVWEKATKGDFTALRRVGVVSDEKTDLEAYEQLYNNFIEVIGLSPEFRQYLQLLKDKIQLVADYMKSDRNGIRDRSLLNRINIIDGQILNYSQTAGKGLTIDEVLTEMSIKFKMHLDKRILTVSQYFGYLNNYKNG